MVLGRRENKSMPRPLEKLAVRARLELALEINRVDGTLAMTRIPIAVDDTPLRIRGTIGSGTLSRRTRGGRRTRDQSSPI